MKRVFLLLAISIFVSGVSFAQSFDEASFRIKTGAGYTHDFPGLNGLSGFLEGTFGFAGRFEGAIGVKRIMLDGNPRTTTVKEHTRATTLDFTVYYLPVQTEVHLIRAGVGYTFSSYNIRRSYPVVTVNGPDKDTHWPIQDQKSRTSGIILVAEYEYMIPASAFSVGLRASLFKAYDRVSYVGPFVGVRL